MDKLRALSMYAETYMPSASQFATYRCAREWMEAGVPAEDAAAWASLGYLPTEAAPLITAGVTPQMAADLGEIDDTVAGSREERAAQVIDRLVADGILIDPRRVHIRQDPNDLHHTIVDIDAG